MAQLVLKNILAGSGNVLAGGDNNGNVNKVTIGANLTLSGGVLSASGGGTGSVTSVALSRSGNALTITGSPITTAGTINIGFAGTTAQYIRGDGTLATFPATTGYVPYTGATQNVDLGEYELKAGQLTLDVSPTGTATVATTRWNNTIGSSETTLKGGTVILKNGVDLVARVVNKVTPNATLTRATYPAVRVSGAQGQRLAVAYAQANNDNNSADTLGLVIEDIATNQEGFIMTVGQLIDVNTTGSLQAETWADGDVLYLSPSTAGKLTNIKPNGSTGHIVVMGYVEYAHAVHGSIYVKVMNGWELDELHNVYISSVANNQGLFYNSTSSLWENKSIATVLGYTPANDANVVKLTGNQTVGGVKTFSAESIFGGGITLTGGDLVLKSGTYTNTINTDTLTESRSILFPDNSGTVALLTDIDYPVLSVFGRTGDVVAVSGDYDTDMVDEGTTNLYYTNARARAALSANTGSALTYNNTTGRFTLNAAESGVSGYLKGTDWDTFNGKQNSLGTGTTGQFLRGDLVWAAVPIPSLSQLPDVTITSPTNGQLLRWRIDHWENWTPNYVSATYFSATAPLSYNSGTGVFNISQATTSTNGYLSSTDWNTFNNKQDALTNPVTGTGATGYIAKWNTASTITNSLIYEASSKVGINTTNMVSLFDVTKNALGVTVVDTSGITLKNETEAITGNQQISPALHFKSNGWNNLAAASQSADWIEYSLPIQGNAVTSNLIWASSINGAAYTTRFTLSSAGNGTFTGTLAASNLSGTNSGDVTIGTANGLSLSGQAISLALASTSTTGALSSTDWNTFNGKQAQINGTGFVKASGTTISYDNSTYLTTTSAASTYVPYTGATGTVNLGTNDIYVKNLWATNGLTYYANISTDGSGAYFQTYRASDNTYHPVVIYGGSGTSAAKTLTINNTSATLTTAFSGTSASFSSTVTATSYNRFAAGTGFLNGKYNGAETTTSTGPIYCIGDTYVPTATTLGAMYGIGYSYNNFTGAYGPANTWGMYVAGGGNTGTFLDAGGNAYFSGKLFLGTTTDAGYKLDVNGTGRFTGNVVLSGSDSRFNGGDSVGRLILSNSSTSTYIALYGASHASVPNIMAFVTNSATALTLASTGAATFSSSIAVGGASHGISGLNLPNQNYVAWYASGGTGAQYVALRGNGSNLELSSGGGITMTMDASQKVGIGTTLPTNKLITIGSETGTQITTTPIGKFVNIGNSFSKLILGSDNANYDAVISMDNNATLANCKLRFYIGNGTSSTAGHSNDQIVLQGDGKLGIGTSDIGSDFKLAINGGNGTTTGPLMIFQNSGTGTGNGNGFLIGNYPLDAYLWNYENANTIFATNNIERMRITSGGNILMNTTTNPTSGGFTNTTLLVKQVADGGAGGGIHIEANGSDNVAFFGFDSANGPFKIGTSYRSSGSYQPITFSTNGPERMRISNAGNLIIGSTTDAGYKLDVNGSSIIRGYVYTSDSYGRTTAGKGYLNGGYAGAESTTSPGPIYCISQNYAPTATSINNMYGIGYSYNNFTGYYGPVTTWGFYVSGGGSIGVFLAAGGEGYFRSSVTATAFFESSDKRLKEELDGNALIDDISKIKAKLYLKEGKKEIGYYAQDLQEIMPYAVSEGGDKYLTLSYSQVHTAKIAKLEAELAELKEIVKNLIK